MQLPRDLIQRNGNSKKGKNLSILTMQTNDIFLESEKCDFQNKTNKSSALIIIRDIAYGILIHK